MVCFLCLRLKHGGEKKSDFIKISILIKAGAFSEKHTSRNLFVQLASIKKKRIMEIEIIK